MCSPFMNPEISNKQNGLCFTANNTQNALFARIEGIYGVPFVIDDITTNPNINLTQFIYTLADGTNKGRLNGDSELRDNGFGWSGVAITSSETCILDRSSQYQGLKARVIHTQGIQWTKDAAEAELVKRIVRNNFGFTGKEFAMFVAGKEIDELCNRYDTALTAVKDLMIKKDNLTDRLASKYAAIYLTVELLNEAFDDYNLSANELLACLIKCEQDTFDERDNARKAYQSIIDFVSRYQSHFIIERKYTDPLYNFDSPKPNDIYGKIIKYDTKWEVHLLETLTKKVLRENELEGELFGIRKKWKSLGLIKCDNDHNTKQYTYTGKKARYDCFMIKGGIQEPEGEEVVVKKLEVDEQKETPISDYYVDDSKIIDEMFGGQDDRN